MVASCSQTKDGFVNRAYHNTTARYNGYFYSRESIKEGVQVINANHKDDFEEILPIFVIAETDEESSPVFGQMDRAISKSTKVIKRHSMKISNKERCRWIDDNFMAVGRAHFYKREFADAEKIFEFVPKEYKDIPTKYDGQFWLARTQIELKKSDDAGLLLAALAQDKDMPAKKKGEFHKVYAHYYIKEGNYAAAADHLMKAIPYERRKKNKNRLNYILGQCYQKADKNADAIKAFQLVAERSSDYNLVFNARIFQAMNAQNKYSLYTVKQDLLKMLKDDKNTEFQDQIYYAIGEVSFKEKKYKEALEHWNKSASVSTTNVRQKSRSFLRIANYHFSQKDYEPSVVAYDSAVAVLPVNFPEGESIKKTAADLSDLVKELKTVKLQDSLLALSQLSPEALDKRLNEIKKQLQKEADDKALADERAAIVKASVAPKAPGPATASAGDFYFYNPSAVKSGMADFKKKWGARKLEDNWRRKNKSQSEGGFGGFDTDDDLTATTDSSKGASGIVIKKEDLKKNIPIGLAQTSEAHNKIIEALYASGNIYKEKFKDNENAIEAFSNLSQRYDTSRYTPTALYQLYRLYLQKETKKGDQKGEMYVPMNTRATSAFFRDEILTRFPDSEFARLVQNPDYLKVAAANIQGDMVDYGRVFNLYKSASYASALLASDSMIVQKNNSLILPKFYFLKSRIQAELHDVNGMIQVLNVIITKFPKTQEAAEAKRILDIIMKKLPPPTPAAGADSTKTAAAPAAAEGFYKVTPSSPHFAVLAYSKEAPNVGEFQTYLLNFHKGTMPDKRIELFPSELDREHPILMIKTFKDKDEAMSYYNAFIADKKFLRNINSTPENKLFVISVDNLSTMFNLKKTEEYLKFFEVQYLK